MENLHLNETKYTPEIVLDAQKGLISMRGKSYPENTFAFYEEVMAWIEKYFIQKVEGQTLVEMEIIYFNSSSSKLFFDLFDLMEEVSSDKEIVINWIYDAENESALEAGEDFKEDFESLNFNLVKK